MAVLPPNKLAVIAASAAACNTVLMPAVVFTISSLTGGLHSNREFFPRVAALNSGVVTTMSQECYSLVTMLAFSDASAY
jgi:hypothetical protein